MRKQQLKKIVKNILGQHTINKFLAHRGEDKDLKTLAVENAELIRAIKQKRLTYLSNKKLVALLSACTSVDKEGLSGVLIEAGCALGGSSIMLASAKASDRPLFVYDVFGMIPPPTSEDTSDVHERYKIIAEGNSAGLGGDEYYGYQENLYEVVQNNFLSFGISIEKQSVSLIKGLLQETLIVDQSVALAHVDVDWYEPVKVCLERIFPMLVIGGKIVLDDYYDWGGCRKATDEYLSTVQGKFSLDDSAGSMIIVKQ